MVHREDGGRKDADVDAISQAIAGLPPSSRRDVLVRLSRGLGAGALLSLLLAFEDTKPSRAMTLYDNPDKIELGALLLKEDSLANTLAIMDITGASYRNLKLANLIATGNVDAETIGGTAKFALTTKTSSYYVALTDSVILADGIITVTLPSAVGIAGKTYDIKRINASGIVTVATTGAQTIDGSSTIELVVQNASITVASDGANWRIV